MGLTLPVHRCVSNQTLVGLLCLSAGASWVAAGCGEAEQTAGSGAMGGSSVATGGASEAGALAGTSAQNSGGSQSAGGASAGGQSCTLPVSGARTHPGNFDTRTCNDCHTGFVGGWVYNNAAGDAYVAEATVTITNSDGTTVTAATAADGFFLLQGEITPRYEVCVSLCPNTDCAGTTHSSTDCQNRACHGGTNPRICLTQETEDPQNTGGSGGWGEDCIPPASGGPRTHNAQEYDTFGCQICHDLLYTGGFLYAGLDSDTPVAQATFTLTPVDGSPPLTAVTGPGGMFYFPGTVPAPYTICASKCPDTVCFGPEEHATDADCRTCHDLTQKIHLP
jgi:hypothetical protein